MFDWVLNAPLRAKLVWGKDKEKGKAIAIDKILKQNILKRPVLQVSYLTAALFGILMNLK